MKAYVCSAVNPTIFLNIFNSQLTALPSMAGRDAKASAPNFFNNLANAFSLHLTQCFTVSGSFDGGVLLPDPPRIPKAFLIAKIIVEIVILIAVNPILPGLLGPCKSRGAYSPPT